jgi:hypothetical protein
MMKTAATRRMDRNKFIVVVLQHRVVLESFVARRSRWIYDPTSSAPLSSLKNVDK